MLIKLVAGCLYHFKPGSTSSQNLITNCWSVFMSYGAPEEFSSNGGQQFTSFQNFWRYGESNIDSHQWATHNPMVELRLQQKLLHVSSGIIHPTMDPSITIKQQKQNHNTPLPKISLSPSQILLHRELCDFTSFNFISYYYHYFHSLSLLLLSLLLLL